jgi:hypothetical protein
MDLWYSPSELDTTHSLLHQLKCLGHVNDTNYDQLRTALLFVQSQPQLACVLNVLSSVTAHMIDCVNQKEGDEECCWEGESMCEEEELCEESREQIVSDDFWFLPDVPVSDESIVQYTTAEDKIETVQSESSKPLVSSEDPKQQPQEQQPSSIPETRTTHVPLPYQGQEAPNPVQHQQPRTTVCENTIPTDLPVICRVPHLHYKKFPKNSLITQKQ